MSAFVDDPVNQCHGKERLTRTQATDAARRQKDRRLNRVARDRRRRVLDAYKCPHCDGWHVGHR